MTQAVLSPAYLYEFYQQLQLPPDAEVVLFRNDLAVVLHYPALRDDLALTLQKWRDRPPLSEASL